MGNEGFAAVMKEFELNVSKHFAFLISEHGFTSRPMRTHSLDDARDATVSIRFKTESVGFQIGLSLIGDGIGVQFKNENWLDDSRNCRVKWVSLESVIAYKTNGSAKSLVQQMTSPRRKYWPEGFLLGNMEMVIQTLASQVATYADDIIRGDLSTFQNIRPT